MTEWMIDWLIDTLTHWDNFMIQPLINPFRWLKLMFGLINRNIDHWWRVARNSIISNPNGLLPNYRRGEGKNPNGWLRLRLNATSNRSQEEVRWHSNIGPFFSYTVFFASFSSRENSDCHNATGPHQEHDIATVRGTEVLVRILGFAPQLYPQSLKLSTLPKCKFDN